MQGDELPEDEDARRRRLAAAAAPVPRAQKMFNERWAAMQQDERDEEQRIAAALEEIPLPSGQPPVPPPVAAPVEPMDADAIRPDDGAEEEVGMELEKTTAGGGKEDEPLVEEEQVAAKDTEEGELSDYSEGEEGDDEEAEAGPSWREPSRRRAPRAVKQRGPTDTVQEPSSSATRGGRHVPHVGRGDLASDFRSPAEVVYDDKADRKRRRPGREQFRASGEKSAKFPFDIFPVPLKAKKPRQYGALMAISARTPEFVEMQVPGPVNFYKWRDQCKLTLGLDVDESQFWSNITRRIPVAQMQAIATLYKPQPTHWRKEYAVADKVYVTFKFNNNCNREMSAADRAMSWTFVKIEHTNDPDDKIPRTQRALGVALAFRQSKHKPQYDDAQHPTADGPGYGIIFGLPKPGPFPGYDVQLTSAVRPQTGTFVSATVAVPPKGDEWIKRVGGNVRHQTSILDMEAMSFDQVKHLAWVGGRAPDLMSFAKEDVMRHYTDGLLVSKVVLNSHNLKEVADASMRRTSVLVHHWFLQSNPVRLAVHVPDVEPDDLATLKPAEKAALRTAQSLSLLPGDLVSVCIPSAKQLARAKKVAEGTEKVPKMLGPGETFAVVLSATVVSATPMYSDGYTEVHVRFEPKEAVHLLPIIKKDFPRYVVLEAYIDNRLGDRLFRRLCSSALLDVFTVKRDEETEGETDVSLAPMPADDGPPPPPPEPTTDEEAAAARSAAPPTDAASTVTTASSDNLATPAADAAARAAADDPDAPPLAKPSAPDDILSTLFSSTLSAGAIQKGSQSTAPTRPTLPPTELLAELEAIDLTEDCRNLLWRSSLVQGREHLFRYLGGQEPTKKLVDNFEQHYGTARPTLEDAEPFAPILVKELYKDIDTDEQMTRIVPYPLLEQQLDFVLAVLGDRYTGVAQSGPPGTGKTATIVALLRQATAGDRGVTPYKDSHVLYLAPTNTACDEFATQFDEQCTLANQDLSDPLSPIRASRVYAPGVGGRADTGSVKTKQHRLNILNQAKHLDYSKLTDKQALACGFLTPMEQEQFDAMPFQQRRNHKGANSNPFGRRRYTFARSVQRREQILERIDALCKDGGLLKNDRVEIPEDELGSDAPDKGRYCGRIYRLNQLSVELEGLNISCTRAALVVLNPQIIIATPPAAGQPALSDYNPMVAFCDEAAYMSYTAVHDVVKLLDRKAEQLILVGDDRQLRALTRLSGDVLRTWNESIFYKLRTSRPVFKLGRPGRIQNRKRQARAVETAARARLGQPPLGPPLDEAEHLYYTYTGTFDTSFRARDELVGLTRDQFYEDVKLHSHESASTRYMYAYCKDSLFWPRDEPGRDQTLGQGHILFDNLTMTHDQPAQGTSRCNLGELQAALKYYLHMRDNDPDGVLAGANPTHLAILAYYKGQEIALDQALTTLGITDAPLVITVDKQQGQQNEITMLCTSRSVSQSRMEAIAARCEVEHPGDHLALLKAIMGFVLDPNRLNVALSRSRAGLIVLLHEETLKHATIWARLIEWAKKHDYYRTNHTETWLGKMETSGDEKLVEQAHKIRQKTLNIVSRVREGARAPASATLLALQIGDVLPMRMDRLLLGTMSRFSEAVDVYDFRYAALADDEFEEDLVLQQRLNFDHGLDICDEPNEEPDSMPPTPPAGPSDEEIKTRRLQLHLSGGEMATREYDDYIKRAQETRQLDPLALALALQTNEEVVSFEPAPTAEAAAFRVTKIDSKNGYVECANGLSFRAGADTAAAKPHPEVYKALLELQRKLGRKLPQPPPDASQRPIVRVAQVSPSTRSRWGPAERAVRDRGQFEAAVRQNRKAWKAIGDRAGEDHLTLVLNDNMRRAEVVCEMCGYNGHYDDECYQYAETALNLAHDVNTHGYMGAAYASLVCAHCRVGGHDAGSLGCPLLSLARRAEILQADPSGQMQRLLGIYTQAWVAAEKKHGKRWRSPPTFDGDSLPAGPLYVMPRLPLVDLAADAILSSTSLEGDDQPSTSGTGRGRGRGQPKPPKQPSDPTQLPRPKHPAKSIKKTAPRSEKPFPPP